jgi:hypothetical protein
MMHPPDSAVRSRRGNLEAVHWIDLRSHSDARGTLTVVESAMDVPFAIQRVYYIHGVRGPRGGHAHRDTSQIVAAVAGACDMTLSDGLNERTFTLDDPAKGLYVCPMLFIRMESFSEGAVILVMANTHYEKSRSIYSWDEYLAEISA